MYPPASKNRSRPVTKLSRNLHDIHREDFTKKGFTLIEILIVVIIIAVLASLIVTRMINQTEKAKAAEAFQVLGVIKRATERERDLTGSFVPTATGEWGAGLGVLQGDWSKLGMNGAQLSQSRHWYYTYAAGGDGSWMQIRVGDAALNPTNYIAYTDPPNIETWYCKGIFKTLEDTSDSYSSRGCKV